MRCLLLIATCTGEKQCHELCCSPGVEYDAKVDMTLFDVGVQVQDAVGVGRSAGTSKRSVGLPPRCSQRFEGVRLVSNNLPDWCRENSSGSIYLYICESSCSSNDIVSSGGFAKPYEGSGDRPTASSPRGPLVRSSQGPSVGSPQGPSVRESTRPFGKGSTRLFNIMKRGHDPSGSWRAAGHALSIERPWFSTKTY